MDIAYLTNGQSTDPANFFPEANTILVKDMGIKQDLHQLLHRPNREAYDAANAWEFRRLSQGIKNNGKGDTITIYFIPWSAMPRYFKATYSSFLANI